jgi:CBS domain-containing protein
MLHLRDIMTTELVTVGPDMTLREALETLGRHHVSGAPVVNGGRLEGVVTSSDLMTLAAALPAAQGAAQEADEDETWGERSLVEDIEDEDEPGSAFFAEMWDQSANDVSDRMAEGQSRDWSALDEHTVSEAMTRVPLVTLPPSADVEAAARLMKDRKIHRVLVTDGDSLVGIVSAFDIAAAVADHRLTKRTFVFNATSGFDERV